MKLKPEDRILFYGDSITDVGRNREAPLDLGHGYPLLVAAYLASHYPDYHFTFFNRGIGGSKIVDLNQRLVEDCLALKPDVLVILIGINDTWHTIDQPFFATPAEQIRFKKAYNTLLKNVTQAGVSRIMLMEPFVLPYPVDRKTWRSDLDQKIQIIRDLAKDYHCEYLPLDGILNAVAIKDDAVYYTGEDGVHPTIAGHGVIAKELLASFSVDER